MSEALNLAQANIKLTLLSPTIGAEIGEVDLTKPLTTELKQAIYQALLDYKVLFFRDQKLTTDQHITFARNFGELEVHPFGMNKDGYKEILELRHDENNKGSENVWHSDVTWRKEPSLGSILRSVHVPSIGGDTLWADMELAYESLSDEVKEKINGLVAVHDFEPFRRRLRAKGVDEEKLKAFDEKYPAAEHPVVRTHPDTGRKSIYVNRPFTRYIKEMDKKESTELLQLLYNQASTPEYQCRFKWRDNSIAFWDNRTTQHYAVSDYWPHVRTMERATIKGDKPV